MTLYTAPTAKTKNIPTDNLSRSNTVRLLIEYDSPNSIEKKVTEKGKHCSVFFVIFQKLSC